MSIFNDMLENEFAVTSQEGPFYTDFLINVQEDYPNIGLKSCPWGTEETTDIPKLYAIKDVLIEHFNFVYKFREIGAETESRWQYTVDRVFDNIKRKYEYALDQYESNLIKKLGNEFSETITRDGQYHTENASEGGNTSAKTGSDTNKNVFNDTPIQALIDENNYASAITSNEIEYGNTVQNDSSSESESSSTVDEDITRTRVDKDKSILELVNDNIDNFRDLIDNFVNEFHVCFISTLGRI